MLLKKALEKVAFLPFGLMIDKWRWQVFSGKDSARQIQRELVETALAISRRRAARSAQRGGFRSRREVSRAGKCPLRALFPGGHFAVPVSPGAWQGRRIQRPLNRCSIYDSKVAGARLNSMLEMGHSQPWPKALAVMTGQEQMDATAILDYFAPLKKWLDEQNAKDGAKLDW